MPSQKYSQKHVYATRSQGIFTEEVPAVEPRGKKRARPFLTERKIDENVNVLCHSEDTAKKTSPVKEAPEHGPKKLKLSRDEAHMNGAPEGDIYDVSVIDDAHLSALPVSAGEAETQLRDALTAASSNEASWAERFNAVELVRRVCLSEEHRQVLQGDSLLLLSGLEFCLHALGSLRSSAVRNSILALTVLVEHMPALKEQELASRILHSLLNPKLVSSASKFISGQATKLAGAVSKSMVPLEAILALAPSTLHRSSDVSNFAIDLIGQLVLQLDRSSLGLAQCDGLDDEEDGDGDGEGNQADSDNENDCNANFLELSMQFDAEGDGAPESTIASSSSSSRRTRDANTSTTSGNDEETPAIKQCLLLLHRGLSAKRASGRDSARKALLYLHSDVLGGATFDWVVRSCCDEITAVDIQREITKRLHSASSNMTSFAIEGQGLRPPMLTPQTTAPTTSKSATPFSKSAGSAHRDHPDRATTGRISIRERMRLHEQSKKEAKKKSPQNNPGSIFIYEDGST